MTEFLTQKLSDALFPKNYTCDICGTETFGGNLCADCLKTITFNSGKTCPVCGRKNAIPEICLECKSQAPVFKKAVSPLVYEGGAVLLIGKFKNGGAYLKDYFAGLLAKTLIGFPKIDCIVYVPMTKRALRRRGYNQTELLSESLARLISVPVLKGAVEKVKDTAEQKGLSRKERENNLRHSFKVADRNAVKGKDVLIIDDVLTTGATADELAACLKKAGAKTVYLATVASVENKRPEPIL